VFGILKKNRPDEETTVDEGMAKPNHEDQKMRREADFETAAHVKQRDIRAKGWRHALSEVLE